MRRGSTCLERAASACYDKKDDRSKNFLGFKGVVGGWRA